MTTTLKIFVRSLAKLRERDDSGQLARTQNAINSLVHYSTLTKEYPDILSSISKLIPFLILRNIVKGNVI